MKNRIVTILLTGIIFMFTQTSCSDEFLQDKRDYAVFAPADIFSDPNQANAVLAKIYADLLGRYNSPLCGSDVLMRQAQAPNMGGQFSYFSEEFGFGTPTGKQSYYSGQYAKQVKAGNHMGNPVYWNDPRTGGTNYNSINRYTLYPHVYMINNYIAQIDQYGPQYPQEDPLFWNKLKGQAIFLRAWLYFDAIRLLGGVPWYSTGMDDLPELSDKSDRQPIAYCIDKICADFETAATLLPDKWGSDDMGRFTSVAAKAMISRVRLYAASPIFNASWDNTGSTRWQAALEAGLAAESAANAAGYGTNVTDIKTWDEAFYNYAAGAFNSEAIILIPKNGNSAYAATYSNTWEALIRPQSIDGSGAGLPAPKQMIDAFPLANGSRAVDLSGNPTNGYDPVKFYRNRDPRFYRTFAFSGCEWTTGSTNTRIWLYAYKYSSQYRYTDGTTGDGGAQKKSKAIVWKMSNKTVAKGSETYAGTDILEYRYAEILLNIAEAYAAKGDVGSCMAYLKKIRTRVGIPSANNYGLGASFANKYAAIEACLYERNVELAYEGKRSWDLRRWLLFDGGAGFDPGIAGANGDGQYDPALAWGQGWKIYDGKDGRPDYTKTDNVVTKLGYPFPLNGYKHIGEIWGYQLSTAQSADADPLAGNADRNAVPAITRDMDDAARNAAFDKLDQFYTSAGLVTENPDGGTMGFKYGMDSGSGNTDRDYLFSFRGWYYVYPLHYDFYDSAKGNDWLKQNAGWMYANANGNATDTSIQDGDYYYCSPE
ncbi:MAG: RagB/SusD family nutrient uptake outer membrane protein [Prevotella sp.]|jgi:hypothetical protein|nr:RagB/SusD family nutrient uptake outer membrane protein [Prevotella sp.]